MVQAETPRLTVDAETQTMHATFEDFELLETGGADVFVLDLNEFEGVPPFYIEVDGRRFGLQRDTFQVLGHGAQFPAWLREQEAEGHIVLLAERDDRYLAYVFDPNAEEEGEEE
jgi:hypothetical protein